ncbi:probable ATP-dependent RNA helicase DDX20 [Daphnia carinata]|uniref:probable ATP-dependent RNA helicase DDX20 n=1 Tax=Daphnia carinata TaxID=120202 RepID=UPI0025799313|nr:probable ATP-dependent RNA helicase DDX20 [Daphnia carinata]
MESEFQRKSKKSNAHSFTSKERTEDVDIQENLTFSDMHLSSQVLKGLTKAGYVKPSPIQLDAIPIGKCGIDMVIQSKSGTGKTLVFGIIMLESIDLQISTVQGLILAPTREIAFQNAHVIYTIGSEFPGLNVQVFIGGLPVETDLAKCKSCHVAVGTPGRVKQLIEKGALKPKSMRLFILDEADKLMEDSFADDVTWIFSQMPLTKQVLAVSATYPEVLANLVSRYMKKPSFVRLGHQQPTLLGVKQFVFRVAYHPMTQQQAKNKFEILLKMLKVVAFGQCMIFTNLQTRAESLAAQLSSSGHAALSISGSQTQTKRLQTLLKLRQYQCKILVATDLAARGIDAEHIDLVIHMDVPRDAATYLHRVGRAGRFGAAALTCTIACEGNELTELRSIITKTRASVRILACDHLAPKDHDSSQPETLLTIQTLNFLWLTLPELEGTGLEGEGMADSLLGDIEHDFVPGLQDSTRALLPQGKKRKNKPRAKTVFETKDSEEVQMENAVAQLSISAKEEQPIRVTQQAWQEWYQYWMAYMRRNKALIEQQEYMALMCSGIK